MEKEITLMREVILPPGAFNITIDLNHAKSDADYSKGTLYVYQRDYKDSDWSILRIRSYVLKDSLMRERIYLEKALRVRVLRFYIVGSSNVQKLFLTINITMTKI